jgi:hypothetical protein
MTNLQRDRRFVNRSCIVPSESLDLRVFRFQRIDSILCAFRRTTWHCQMLEIQPREKKSLEGRAKSRAQASRYSSNIKGAVSRKLGADCFWLTPMARKCAANPHKARALSSLPIRCFRTLGSRDRAAWRHFSEVFINVSASVIAAATRDGQSIWATPALSEYKEDAFRNRRPAR